MTERTCTVEAPTPEAGRDAGARELGVRPEDVVIEDLGAGRFRITAVQGPGVIELEISQDMMEARLKRLSPALGEHPQPTQKEVLAALEKAGVRFGILQEEIEAAVTRVAERGEEIRDLIIARATRAVPGSDSRIEYVLDPSDSSAGTELDSGQIDYHEKQMAHPAHTGEVIGTWHPPGPGNPGRRLDGREIAAEPGQDCGIEVDESILLRELEDGLVALEAAIDGVVQILPSGLVKIVDMMEIQGDVGLETGNIDVGGSVCVQGCVDAGFRLCAKHDITVKKTVEDAFLEAGGSIIVRRGIVGGDYGKVVAGKHVILNFSQNAKIESQDDVVIANSDTNSEIHCGGRIVATEGKGRLRGGTYRATLGVVAKEIGSDLGAPTRVIVGVDPPPPPERMEQSGEGGSRRKTPTTPPFVDVLGDVHNGVVISIWGFQRKIENTLNGVRFYLDQEEEEIKVTAIDRRGT